ncbi:Gfo/Idh/MocA family protein [Saccharospirillum salsuginis]|uniref:Oxidoreductase n=1 Tax=Saccharospirillum salsuginis TaxID=418750 RepID=A0A918K5C1_9GAMM|nr:Gfo/Idh/MocA family oxidoreductase [Saccharospirillum salsuginis]GGX47263.1 oxidoreductase [Saccharospirillum salsuginis]
MTQQPIRWGILGAGNIAHKLADAVRYDADSQMVACASRTPGKARSFAENYDIDAYDSYEALLERDDIDVVYIATTHNFHHDNGRLALAYNKPILMEKPFTVNASEADDLISEARAKGVFLMEAIWTRFLPAQRALRQQLREGIVGEVKHLTASFGGFAPPHYAPRIKDPELAGGVTLDMGIYPISLLCYLVGELPNEIESMCRFSDRGVDEIASYLFRFPSGATAVISTSFNLKMKQEVMVYGSEGYIEYPNFQSGPEFIHHRHDGTNEILDSTSHPYMHEENGFVYEVAEVARCLRAGETESPVIPLDESRAIMAVMDKMRADWGLKYPFE